MEDDIAFAACLFVCMVCMLLIVGLVAGVGHTLGMW